MSQANPTMLVMGRESRRLTQTALASQIGVAQATISKSEAGQCQISGDLVAKYAAALRYPISFFHEPYRFRHLPITFHRKKLSVSSGDVKAVQATTNIIRIHISKLIAPIDLPEPRIPRIDIQQYNGSAASVARDLRIRWHVPRGPIDNLTSIIEDAGVLVVRCDFGTNMIDGLSFYEPTDVLPPMLLINRRIPTDRYRFTVAHELAHLVLHHHLSMPTQECEIEADQFASEFLMPAAEIRGFLGRMTIEKLLTLKPYWKVSMGALLKRAGDLGCITERQSRYLWMHMSKRGYRTEEPMPLAAEEPTLIAEMLQYHSETLKYADTELASLLSLECGEFHEMYPGLKRTMRLVGTGLQRQVG